MHSKEHPMKRFFNPKGLAVFGVADHPLNLARNILFHCRAMGFQGPIYPVGRTPGRVDGHDILLDPNDLPEGLDLAVILVPARAVSDTLAACGKKGIHHAIISTGGFRELDPGGNQVEKTLLDTARQYGIRFIGPNCIGIIDTHSGLCTPFNPIHPAYFKKGNIGLVVQSGGVTTQSAYTFSEEHVGFSKIISVGNKLDVTEIDLVSYLLQDEDTHQIHLYLESIEQGRELMALARRSSKPMVVFKSNVTATASQIAQSHTAALSNNDRVVAGALRQAGMVRVSSIQEMTVAAKALKLPPLQGDDLLMLSFSGGFSVILGDACERYGFHCPPLPRNLLDKIESFRRGGVIRMGNPMDFGDVHDLKALVFTLEASLALEAIHGVVLSFMYDPKMEKIFGGKIGSPEQMLTFMQHLCDKTHKPIALSFFGQRRYIRQFQEQNTFPVFNGPEESVQAMRLLRDYRRGRERYNP